MKLNDLNSILIEGRLIEEPIRETPERLSKVRSFVIVSTQHHDENGNVIDRQSEFTVEVYDDSLAETCAVLLRKGRLVRITGRIVNDHGQIFIIAKRVELRTEVDL